MNILAVDDEEFVRLVLTQTLQAEGCAVATASGGQAAIERLGTDSFDAVITDLRMPGIDGRGVLRWIKDHQPDVDVIVLTGHGAVQDAVEAMREGAWDFLVKDTPFDGTAVKAALAKLRTLRALRRENLAARRGGYSLDDYAEGSSQAWHTLKTQILRIAPAQAPVLISGETGSGKEVVARLLHAHSARAAGPFIAINCGAVSRELLESELFGHEKGAFTGAATARQGLIAAAECGTLFLDEVGEMPGPMQVGLLRVLDRGEYRPVGSTRTRHADVRVIGATNQDLQELAHQGRFRDDLLYRINTIGLQVPPLRERTDDLPALVGHLLRGVRVPGSGPSALAPDALAALAAYRWPGNIRELRNVLERIMLMRTGSGPITEADVRQILGPVSGTPSGIPPPGSTQAYPAAELLSLEDIERRHILQVLESQRGNKTQTAKILQIDYKTLLSKLKKYGVADNQEG
ncbi:MAG: sigma-54 dependent transcriptional regulator [Nitrospiraceae bacterium]